MSWMIDGTISLHIRKFYILRMATVNSINWPINRGSILTGYLIRLKMVKTVKAYAKVIVFPIPI